MQVMLQNTSGSKDYYRRGPKAEDPGFLGIRKLGRLLSENVGLKIVEFRYNRARKDMVKSSTKAAYAKALSVGLVGVHQNIRGYIQRTELKAEASSNQTSASAQQTVNAAEKSYSAFTQ